MKSDKTDVIGFLTPELDEFHAQLLNHLARLFRQSGRTLLTYCHDGDIRLLSESLSYFAGQNVDALILAGHGDIPNEVERFVERGIPVTVYNNDIMGLRVDRVFVENAKASYRAVRHLIDLGHTRIATAFGTLDTSSGLQRLNGYQQALKRAGFLSTLPTCIPATGPKKADILPFRNSWHWLSRQQLFSRPIIK